MVNAIHTGRGIGMRGRVLRIDLVAQSEATPRSPSLGRSIHAASRLRLTIDATLGTSFSSMNEHPKR